MTAVPPEPLVLAYPDPVTSPAMLSGAAFLYFASPLCLTLPPVVITKGSYELLPLIDQRRPDWSRAFEGLVEAWRRQHRAWDEMLSLLAPLREDHLRVIWLVYPGNAEALERAAALAESTGLPPHEVGAMVNPENACGELVRHIMLEAFLECGQDVDALYEYCCRLFGHNPLPDLLANAYLLRLPMLADHATGGTRVLLTNQRLTTFLCAMPVDTSPQGADVATTDVIAWELFRQILSPRVDPLNAKSVELIAKLLRSRNQEIQRLRRRCHVLADQLKEPRTVEHLPQVVTDFIETYVAADIAQVLELDRRSLQQFLLDLFADEKTWLALAATITALAAASPNVTVGGAIAAAAVVGGKAFKAAAQRRERLRQDDYALVYTLSRHE